MIKWSWVIAAVLLTGCTPDDNDATTCPGGQINIDGTCVSLCVTARDCPSEQICGSSGYCVPAQGARRCQDDGDCEANEQCDVSAICVALDEIPRIDSVVGDRVDGTVDAAMRVEGARLSNVVASLDGPGGPYSLQECSGSTDASLLLDLPDNLTPGDYTLTVTNQAGTCAQTLQFLQGSPDSGSQIVTKLNQARVADSTDVPIGSIPGDLISVIQVQAESGGLTRSIRVAGTEQVDSTGPGMFLVLIDRASHTVQSGTVNGAPVGVNYSPVTTDITGLTNLLDSLQPDTLVIFASRGDISNMGVSGPLTSAMARLGASPAFGSLTATQAYVLIGIPGLGAGNGLEMVADSSAGPVGVATIVIDGGATGLHGPLSP